MIDRNRSYCALHLGGVIDRSAGCIQSNYIRLIVRSIVGSSYVRAALGIGGNDGRPLSTQRRRRNEANRRLPRDPCPVGTQLVYIDGCIPWHAHRYHVNATAGIHCHCDHPESELVLPQDCLPVRRQFCYIIRPAAQGGRRNVDSTGTVSRNQGGIEGKPLAIIHPQQGAGRCHRTGRAQQHQTKECFHLHDLPIGTSNTEEASLKLTDPSNRCVTCDTVLASTSDAAAIPAPRPYGAGWR